MTQENNLKYANWDELVKASELSEDFKTAIQKTKDAKKVIDRADVLFKRGVSLENHDEEQAFVMFQKYIAMIHFLQKSPTYKDENERKFLSLLIGKEKVNTAFSSAERLQKILTKRYDKMAMDKMDQKRQEGKAEAARKLSTNKSLITNGNSPEKKLEDEEVEDKVNMKVGQLKSLIDQKSTPFLLVDVRNKDEFHKCHVNHQNCILIPPELLSPGISSDKILKSLKENAPDAYLGWSKRCEVNHIILMDRCSSAGNKCGPVQFLFNALSSWDLQVTDKEKIRILKGGIRDIYYSYPNLLTAPLPQEDSPPTSISTLKNVDYDTAFNILEPKPILAPHAILNSDSSSTSSTSSSSTNGEIQFIDRKDLPVIPTISRNLKPSAKSKDLEENYVELLSDQEKIISGEENWKKLYEESANKNDPELVEKLAQQGEYIKRLELSLVQKEQQVRSISKSYIEEVRGRDLSRVSEEESKQAEKEREVGKRNAEIIKMREERKKLEAKKAAEMKKKLEEEELLNKENIRKSNQKKDENKNDAGVYKEKLKDSNNAQSDSCLKRSFSSPNIKDSVSNEEISSLKPNMPLRALKPTNEKRRDFEPVSSTKLVPTGLKNLGNTCYMNSILQCLFATNSFRNYLGKEYQESLNKTSTTRCEIVKELASVIQNLNCGNRSINISNFRNVFGRHFDIFRTRDQQDSHEFITILLDSLHEELNKGSGAKLPEQANSKMSDTDAANLAWDAYVKSQYSIISQLFCGQQRSRVKCLECRGDSTTFETFFILTLPLPSGTSRRVSLSDCLALYTQEEEVTGWNCPKCKTRGKALKKIDLWRNPKYLIIHLQSLLDDRCGFYNDGYWKKRITDVDFSHQFSLDDHYSDAEYELYGISNHYGTMDGGHYTAFCQWRNRKWCKFDDQDVGTISSNQVSTSAAYILFYERVNRG